MIKKERKKEKIVQSPIADLSQVDALSALFPPFRFFSHNSPFARENQPDNHRTDEVSNDGQITLNILHLEKQFYNIGKTH